MDRCGAESRSTRGRFGVALQLWGRIGAELGSIHGPFGVARSIWGRVGVDLGQVRGGSMWGWSGVDPGSVLSFKGPIRGGCGVGVGSSWSPTGVDPGAIRGASWRPMGANSGRGQFGVVFADGFRVGFDLDRRVNLSEGGCRCSSELHAAACKRLCRAQPTRRTNSAPAIRHTQGKRQLVPPSGEHAPSARCTCRRGRSSNYFPAPRAAAGVTLTPNTTAYNCAGGSALGQCCTHLAPRPCDIVIIVGRKRPRFGGRADPRIRVKPQ